MKNKKYIQYVYHFVHYDSIDVRTITDKQLNWIKDMLVNRPKGRINYHWDSDQVVNLCTEHYPELLV